MNETLLFGLTMLVIGMGGTLLTLTVMAFILRLLTKIFPAERTDKTNEEAGS